MTYGRNFIAKPLKLINHGSAIVMLSHLLHHINFPYDVLLRIALVTPRKRSFISIKMPKLCYKNGNLLSHYVSYHHLRNADKCTRLLKSVPKGILGSKRALRRTVCIIQELVVYALKRWLVDGILHKTANKASIDSRLTWKCINYILMIQAEQTLQQQHRQQQ